ncbi:unnamed protein product, partial [Symbiodinium natans]
MLSAHASHAFRAALGCCLASAFALVPNLQRLFTQEVQPLLPTAAIMSLFCAGNSLEETGILCLESVLGTLIALANVTVSRSLAQESQTQTLFICVGSVALVMVACLLPVSENAKMYTVGLTAYFTMDSCQSGNSTGPLPLEYLMVSLLGSVCTLSAYLMPLPGVQDPRARKGAGAAFSDIAEGCAEVITEAKSAFLGTGAGEAWRAVAQQRLSKLSERLREARYTASYRNPLVLLDPAGRFAMARKRQEAALSAAAETLDICCLLCELAARPQLAYSGDSGGSAEADLVRSAAEPAITRVVDGAADLLQNLGRSFQEGNDASERKRIRQAAQAALRDSSAAARELLLLKQ